MYEFVIISEIEFWSDKKIQNKWVHDIYEMDKQQHWKESVSVYFYYPQGMTNYN